ncbi:T9SS type A sorting domain-containing protein [candidate division KSB1 bacterium]|nr:T9SS type A sorting domain-containing protein [candidate division KSB1 bacterium]
MRQMKIMTLIVLSTFCWVSIMIAGIIKIPENYKEIQQGINAAVNGDTVLIAEGTYYERIDFKGKSITVASYFLLDGDTTHISNTIIDGSQSLQGDSGSVVYFTANEDTNSILYGLTITGGSGTTIPPLKVKIGGGILCFNATPRLSHNHIESNAVTVPDTAIGGGVAIWADDAACPAIVEGNLIHHNSTYGTNYATGGGLFLRAPGRIISNIVTENSASSESEVESPGACGGGIACVSSTRSKPNFNLIENNLVNSNKIMDGAGVHFFAASGAGIFVRYSNVVIEHNLISHNEMTYIGGRFWGVGLALEQVDDASVIQKNRILYNFFGFGVCEGGGIYVYDCAPLINNNIIAHNSANFGGGIAVRYSHSKIINNTIVQNNSTNGGGFSSRGKAHSFIMNTIIWGNTAPNDSSVYIGELDTVTIVYSNIQNGFEGTGNIDLNPQFVDTLYHLAKDSPCLGKGIVVYEFAGNQSHSPDCDIDGNPRPNPSSSNPDMGAYEEEWAGVTASENIVPKIFPDSYLLLQNFPNPFNNATIIEFSIPKSGFVKLKIYNLRGEEVSTIIAEQLPAGIHRYTWNALDLASGVYQCQIEVDGFVQNKKMILLR